ncbi:hypothetical protein [Agitococcus lubricus]|uniref:Uncharacterized protein n=1 Tax=Agitococcus lubricus TaxID=1077255 RepID=A0A2T5J1I6_9GAMM|nr:hypothetical protein [Agitococcus lubricus]PTQ90304.1 hypothetical protein C8N29_10357 [Agitococcus lubricus]
MHIGFIILGTALLSSVLTVLVAWLFLRQVWQQQLEYRLRQLHDDIGRTVETRVRRAVTESLRDARPTDTIRENTWKAAKTSSDILSDSFSVLLSRWRKQPDELER